MRDKYEAVSLQLDFYKISLLNSEELLESCINDTEVYKNKIKSYVAKEQEMAKLIATQTADSDTKEQGIKVLKDNVLALQQLFASEKQALSNQIEELKTKLQASKTELKTVVEEKQILSETALMAKTIEENTSQQITEFETKLAVLEDKIRDKDKELASSKTDFNSFEKRMSKTVAELLQEKDKINRDLETEITNLKCQLVIYQEKEKLMGDEITAKMSECEAYKALQETGKSSKTELKAENNSLKYGTDSVFTETLRVKEDSSLTRIDNNQNDMVFQPDLKDVTLKLDCLSQELKKANQRIEILNIEKSSLCKSVIIAQKMQDKIRKECFDHQERSDHEINQIKKAFLEEIKLKDDEIFQLKNKVKKKESKKGEKGTIFKTPVKEKTNEKDASKTLEESDKTSSAKRQ